MSKEEKALKKKAKAWEEEARRYAQNADYWRKRYERIANVKTV